MREMETESLKRRFSPLVTVLAVVAVLIVAALIYIGWRYGAPRPSEETGPGGLTEAQRAEILRSLELPPNTPPLTEAQKAEITNSLELPPNTPPLTERQKREIEQALGD